VTCDRRPINGDRSCPSTNSPNLLCPSTSRFSSDASAWILRALDRRGSCASRYGGPDTRLHSPGASSITARSSSVKSAATTTGSGDATSTRPPAFETTNAELLARPCGILAAGVRLRGDVDQLERPVGPEQGIPAGVEVGRQGSARSPRWRRAPRAKALIVTLDWTFPHRRGWGSPPTPEPAGGPPKGAQQQAAHQSGVLIGLSRVSP
jgi:hypothetical protein